MRLTSTSSMLLASVAISSAAAMPLSPIVVPTQDVAALLGLTSASSTPSFASSASVPTRGPALHRKKRDDAGFTLDDPDTSSVLGAQMGLPAFIEGTELEPAAAIPINSWMRAHSTTFTTQSTAAAVSTASSTNPLFPTPDPASAAATVVTTPLPTNTPDTSIPQVTPSASASASTDREGNDDSPSPQGGGGDTGDDDDETEEPDVGGLIDDLNVLLPPNPTTAIPFAATTPPSELIGATPTVASQKIALEDMVDEALAMLEGIPDELISTRALPTSHPIKSAVAVTSELYGVPTDTSEANPEYTANELVVDMADIPHLTYTVLPTHSVAAAES